MANSDTSQRSPKRKRLALVAVTVTGAVVVLMVALAVGTGYSTSSDQVAIHVGAGPFESKRVKGCEDANTRAYFWQTNDAYIYYPTSEREWDATGQAGADSDPFTSVTKDNVVMSMPITIRFTLKTGCEDLTEFYNKFGRRYDAHIFSNSTWTEGWLTMLRKLVADPSDQTLDRIVQQYPWRQVWNDPTTKVAIENAMNEALNSQSSLLNQVAKGSYFEGITVLVGTPDPANEDLKTAVALEQAAVAKAQSEEAQAKADAEKARAQVAVAEAEAAKKQAEIAGYGSVDAYLKALLILKGGNPYQPTYLYGGTPQANRTE